MYYTACTYVIYILHEAAAVAVGPAFDDSAWDRVPVPSNWQLLGYEAPVYANIIACISGTINYIIVTYIN